MMTTGIVSGTQFQGTGGSVQAGGAGMNMQTDPVSKSIQNQITNAQKQLQELSSNEDMSAEEKMKKRQEIQQEITNLNQQLRQHQTEQRKERQSKQSSDGASADARTVEKRSARAAGGSAGGLSKNTMTAIISADSSMKQAQVQGSVASRMNGRAGVLKAEIKQDGGAAPGKEAELAEAEQKAAKASASQIGTLAEASRKLGEAAETDQAERSGQKKEVNAEADVKNQESEKDQEPGRGKETQEDTEGKAGAQGAETSLPDGYKPVDIRL